tara:strand:- start:230 stop:712 length:483 start_codon:yes stop_codon:yes gene_type:complete
MARKPSAAPFRMKYTDGKKASPSAFFQMDPTMAPAPNPAVDQAINRKVEKKITEKVDSAMSKPGDSPALVKPWTPPKSGGVINEEEEKKDKKGSPAQEKKKKINWGKLAGKVAEGAGIAFTHGLDAVYGTGKLSTKNFFSKKKKDEGNGDNENNNEEETA